MELAAHLADRLQRLDFDLINAVPSAHRRIVQRQTFGAVRYRVSANLGLSER